jgi:hypothetical protein
MHPHQPLSASTSACLSTDTPRVPPFDHLNNLLLHLIPHIGSISCFLERLCVMTRVSLASDLVKASIAALFPVVDHVRRASAAGAQFECVLRHTVTSLRICWAAPSTLSRQRCAPISLRSTSISPPTCLPWVAGTSPDICRTSSACMPEKPSMLLLSHFRDILFSALFLLVKLGEHLEFQFEVLSFC